MSNLTLVLLAAGNSSRFEMEVKKQWLRIGDQPLWLYVAQNFEKLQNFSKIIVVSSQEDIVFMKQYASYEFVIGGDTRQQSLKNALSKVQTEYVLVSDIARACVRKSFLENILNVKTNADCVVPYLKATDTIVYDNETDKK